LFDEMRRIQVALRHFQHRNSLNAGWGGGSQLNSTSVPHFGHGTALPASLTSNSICWPQFGHKRLAVLIDEFLLSRH
jgi:hypothetical protein